MYMKSKPSIKKPHPKKFHLVRVIVLSVLVLIVLSVVIYAWISRIQYDEKVTKEDITFARIETYVNTAKAYLESELPNGGWQIEKYCKEPGSKGTIDEYMCSYGVVASHDLGSTEALRYIAQTITGDATIYIYPDHPSFSFSTEFDPKLPKSCGFYSWEEEEKRLAVVDCDSGSVVTRYDLKD